jgi:hypothetical protein
MVFTWFYSEVCYAKQYSLDNCAHDGAEHLTSSSGVSARHAHDCVATQRLWGTSSRGAQHGHPVTPQYCFLFAGLCKRLGYLYSFKSVRCSSNERMSAWRSWRLVVGVLFAVLRCSTTLAVTTRSQLPVQSQIHRPAQAHRPPK